MKRILDILASLLGLLLLAPLLIPICFLIWRQDYHPPFYVAPRVGRGGKTFRMVKLRSMIINADKNSVDSTKADDNRITGIGRFVRRYKFDEIPQLWNVLKGEMSLVGPRPNVERETNLYTDQEKKLLTVPPGITDLASIVFADEGDILKGSADPDLDYNQLIRPWKSRLGLLYVENRSLFLDVQLLVITVLAIVSRRRALTKVGGILNRLKADRKLIEVCRRDARLIPFPPPGSSEVVRSRQVA